VPRCSLRARGGCRDEGRPANQRPKSAATRASNKGLTGKWNRAGLLPRPTLLPGMDQKATEGAAGRSREVSGICTLSWTCKAVSGLPGAFARLTGHPAPLVAPGQECGPDRCDSHCDSTCDNPPLSGDLVCKRLLRKACASNLHPTRFCLAPNSLLTCSGVTQHQGRRPCPRHTPPCARRGAAPHPPERARRPPAPGQRGRRHPRRGGVGCSQSEPCAHVRCPPAMRRSLSKEQKCRKMKRARTTVLM